MIVEAEYHDVNFEVEDGGAMFTEVFRVTLLLRHIAPQILPIPYVPTTVGPFE